MFSEDRLPRARTLAALLRWLALEVMSNLGLSCHVRRSSLIRVDDVTTNCLAVCPTPLAPSNGLSPYRLCQTASRARGPGDPAFSISRGQQVDSKSLLHRGFIYEFRPKSLIFLVGAHGLEPWTR